MKKFIFSALTALAFASTNASADVCHTEYVTVTNFITTCNYIYDAGPFEPIEKQFTYTSTSGYQQCPSSMNLWGYDARLLDVGQRTETQRRAIRVCEDI